MSTKKKVEKKAVKGSATTAVKKVVKPETKKDEKPTASNKTLLPGITPETDKSALKRQRFMAARNSDVLVVRISSGLLSHLAEQGWKRGGQGGAATIAREILEAWYAKECEKANRQIEKHPV